jgi:hypothetical protein
MSSRTRTPTFDQLRDSCTTFNDGVNTAMDTDSCENCDILLNAGVASAHAQTATDVAVDGGNVFAALLARIDTDIERLSADNIALKADNTAIKADNTDLKSDVLDLKRNAIRTKALIASEVLAMYIERFAPILPDAPDGQKRRTAAQIKHQLGAESKTIAKHLQLNRFSNTYRKIDFCLRIVKQPLHAQFIRFLESHGIFESSFFELRKLRHDCNSEFHPADGEAIIEALPELKANVHDLGNEKLTVAVNEVVDDIVNW